MRPWNILRRLTFRRQKLRGSQFEQTLEYPVRVPERGSLARGDDLQVAEVAQALGTELHAEVSRHSSRDQAADASART